jgi:uncharacterized protein (TIGR02594 family)
MPGVSRDNDTAEGDLIPSQTTVFANNELIIVDGDEVASHDPGGIHGPPNPTVPANPLNPHVYVENKLAIIKGTAATCTHTTTGSSDVWIYEGYAPPVILTPEQAAAVDAAIEEAVSNPPDVGSSGGTQADNSSYAGQVPQVYEGAPAAGVDDLGTTTPLVDASVASSTASADQIPGFLSQVLAEANAQNWDELGFTPPKGDPRPAVVGKNPNILNIWSELGFPATAYWQDDQTPWCAGFCNWVLKRTGYKYMQSAKAYDFRDKTSVYGGVPVPLDAGQPGDIVVWNYSHVNFIYTVPSPGVYTFVGGNQSDKASPTNNNPSGGTITNSWPGGWRQSNGRISGIFRPVRA